MARKSVSLEGFIIGTCLESIEADGYVDGLHINQDEAIKEACTLCEDRDGEPHYVYRLIPVAKIELGKPTVTLLDVK